MHRGALFLEEFVGQLSLAYYKIKFPELSLKKREEEKEKTKELKKQLEELKQMPEFREKPKIESILHKRKQLQIRKPLLPSRLTLARRPLPHPIKKVSYQPIKPKATAQILPPATVLRPEAVGVGKLNEILKDAEVTKIECKGPGKPLFVTKRGLVYQTKITLSAPEIEKIIKTFSEKAKVPALSGVFRAAVGNLVISAIISEFVGNKFIIFKRGPYSFIH